MKAIVSLSGGMDSTTVLAVALDQGREVEAVGFTYGSKHNRWENAAATRIAVHYKVPFRLIDLSGVMVGFQSNLLKTGGDIPEGHYEEESMRQTVVPGRNSIFASVLLGLAQSVGAEEVWLGAHAGDHHIYPDCRPAWVEGMDRVYDVASDGTVCIRTPFIQTDKVGILRRGTQLNVPYHLTRTCYKNQGTACGLCGSCQERLTAFAEIGVPDPLPYESRVLLPRVK